MDGISALDLKDIVIDVLHSSLKPTLYPGKPVRPWAIKKAHQQKNEETFQPRWCQIDQCWSCYFKRKTFSRRLMTWKVMRKSEWKDIVNWRMRRLSSCTKSLLHAWTTITSRKKNWIWSENCPKYDHKLSWNACIWKDLIDLTFFGS